MAELADAHGSGPCDSNIMRVQVPFPASDNDNPNPVPIGEGFGFFMYFYVKTKVFLFLWAFKNLANIFPIFQIPFPDVPERV